MWRAWVLAGVLGWGMALGAQARLHVDEATARRNLMAHEEPQAPGSAGAAGVRGKVVLKVDIDPDGRVLGLRVLSGPGPLRGAALDAVRDWRFRPFLRGGAPVGVSTELSVEFRPGPAGGVGTVPAAAGASAPAAAGAGSAAGSAASSTVGPAVAGSTGGMVLRGAPMVGDKVANEFNVLAEKCHSLVGERAEGAAEVKACGAAAREAEKFGRESRYIERRSAYVYYATALMRTNDLKKAVLYGGKAIAVVKQGHDDASGASAAYTVRAQAEAFAGSLASADADLTVAEDFERKAMHAGPGREPDANERPAFKSLLAFHAKVLTALGRKGEAEKKLAEAGTL